MEKIFEELMDDVSRRITQLKDHKAPEAARALALQSIHMFDALATDDHMNEDLNDRWGLELIKLGYEDLVGAD